MFEYLRNHKALKSNRSIIKISTSEEDGTICQHLLIELNEAVWEFCYIKILKKSFFMEILHCSYVKKKVEKKKQYLEWRNFNFKSITVILLRNKSLNGTVYKKLQLRFLLTVTKPVPKVLTRRYISPECFLKILITLFRIKIKIKVYLMQI